MPSIASIASVKAQIEAQEGITPQQQRLIFGGRQLDDDITLFEYGINEEATVVLVLRACQS